MPHVAFLPSGLGSFTAFFRLASLLSSSSCKITFILVQPQASSSKDPNISSFFLKHPQIKRFDFEIPPPLDNGGCTSQDPFIKHLEGINSSLHLLNRILDSVEPPAPVSAIFSDFALAATLTQIMAFNPPPLYIVSTTSAKFYSTVAYLPVLMTEHPNAFSSSYLRDLEVPGLAPIKRENIPPTWLDESPFNYLVKAYLLPNAQSLPKVNGVFLNTFDRFEPETIAVLRSGEVLSNLPPVFTIGPLEPYELEKKGHHFTWLDEHSPESVIYVDFGSKGAMPADQMKELAKGLVICGYSFLWVTRKNQDEKDYENELRDLFGDSFPKEMNSNGKVLKGNVNREDILAHPAIGGFVNQCEWDSVMDAAREGVPILAWPQHGDQKMNAEAVENAGLGLWIRSWGWAGEKLVKRDEIRDKLTEMMTDSRLRYNTKRLKEEARKAGAFRGTDEVIQILKSPETPRNY
ncbi:hypothetical protein M9H77_15545 [Catharanthus roseus]|uniref:Uncharacterized protein n=1 Tax=Catharanthus roseus TaxID=4058 RepID=A0ACC0AZ07_CATRO|nr:hypothetical protein M9H77_15545 [Catharanthus roseus]